MVVCPWRSPGLDAANICDTHRALVAFHGYVRLAATPGTPDAGDVRRRAYERAHCLGEQLRTLRRPRPAPAARRLVEWLGPVLETPAFAPPPPGATLHLLLDRYVREAEEVAAGPLADRPLADRAPAHGGPLAALLRAELRAVRTVLAEKGAWAELGELTAAGRERPFPEVRPRIAETLLRLTPDGYSLGAPAPGAARPPDDTVRHMVETSSRELALLGALSRPRRDTPTRRSPARSG